MRTAGGKSAFAVLLVSRSSRCIPILALLPLLATIAPTGGAHAERSAMSDLPGWQHALARARRGRGGHLCRAVFVAAVLPLHRGDAFARDVHGDRAAAGGRHRALNAAVGLSPALGAFLAGVVLAESEYRHQLETDIEPFKGLLLGLFFISVGAGINFALIAAQPEHGGAAGRGRAGPEVYRASGGEPDRTPRANAAFSLCFRARARRRIRLRALRLCDAERRPHWRHGEPARRQRRPHHGRRAHSHDDQRSPRATALQQCAAGARAG